MSYSDFPWHENDFKPGDRIIVGVNPGHKCNVVSSGRSGEEVVIVVACEEGSGDRVYPNLDQVRYEMPEDTNDE